jgi:RNA polymerase sigma-70 factor (ECF subfamily)
LSVIPPNSDSAPAWLESLYRDKAAGLILYGRALGLSHAESEDVLQETFLAILNLDRTPANPAGYCLRAFRNRALNYRRSLWRRLTRELTSRSWFEQESSRDGEERKLMATLASLPCEQREVIVLKVWHAYTFMEIGALTGVSPNTAAGRYRYGLDKLRNCLRKASYENDEQLGGALALLDSQTSIRQD